MDQQQQARMSLSEHFEKLRIRLFYAVIGLAVGTIICWIFRERIMDVVQWPLVQSGFEKNPSAWSPAETVLEYLKICLVAGMLLSSPWIAYQLWSFIGAGLYPKERRIVYYYAGGSTLLFIIGLAFCYFIMLPLILNVLISFGSEEITQEMRISEYINFFFKLSLAMGISFQVPILMRFLSAMDIVDRSTWKSHRKYAIVGGFLGAALLTPPEPISQISAGLPIVLLYEVGILLIPAESSGTMEDSAEEENEAPDTSSENGEGSSTQ